MNRMIFANHGRRRFKHAAIWSMAFFSVVASRETRGAIRIYPSADGTIVDNDIAGTFDGVGDAADWTFNGSGLEIGGVARSVPAAGTRYEYRTIWEYNLTTVNYAGSVAAWLTFTTKGATINGFPDADVHIYAYAADLRESLADFSAAPATFANHVLVSPFQPATPVSVCVGDVVNAEFASGRTSIGFRFQIDPATLHTASQAFIIASDSDETTKPLLTVSLAGDANGDGAVALNDLRSLAFCMTGPGGVPLPSCHNLDLDCDRDVDLADFARFLSNFGNAD